MNGIVDSVRGMRDVLPAEYSAQAAVAARLEHVLSSAGYQPVDLPILERRDLYQRKLGEELVGKVYEFSFNGRELALRPEWTASVLRAYVARMQEQPLPLRLRYAGPVFRNERPQRATYRQFTQVGVELVGGPAPRADAECIALACAGLDAAGVDAYHVRVGHIGLIRAVLGSLGLPERTQGLLAWSLERMRSHGADSVREQLHLDEEAAPLFDASLLEGLSDDQAEALLLHALGAIGVQLQFGTRPPEAIVRRLVRKLRREDQRPAIERALALLGRLAMISGPPAEALPQAEALLREFELPTSGLEELRAILDLVVASGVPAQRLVADFGLGRGLHYYTGVIFEIYTDEVQLCGGGRYDDLVTTLGGRQTVPAVGFAYGLERVALAARPAERAERTPEVQVVATDDTVFGYAQQVAARLRNLGYVATVDVRGRTVATNARDAARRGALALAVVGPAQVERTSLLWRDLASREEQERLLETMEPAR